MPNVRQRDFQEPEPDAVVYLPYRTQSRLAATLLVRSMLDPGGLTPLVQAELRVLDPDLPLYGIRTLDDFLSQSRWSFRVFGIMFSIFAGIALLLSAVGLYAVTAFSVSQRTQEVGIRMALGGQPDQVKWLFVRSLLPQLTFGLALGLAGAWGVGRLLESLLVRTSPEDPATLLTIAGILMVVAGFACFWPARRATYLNPVTALRYE